MNRNGKAIPTAKDVVIMGELAVGGTISGSYIYQNVDENPEGTSIFRWYNDGVVIANTVNLTLLPAYDGMVLIFSVTPVSLSEETGVETFSEQKTVTSTGYQNISDEESENSFMKQRGDYAFHATPPTDRFITATAGAFALKNRTTQNVSVRGPDAFGGVVPPPIAVYLQNNPAVTMFSTINCFGALVPILDGNQLMVWGPGLPAALPDLRDIYAVYANTVSFAFIYKNPKQGDNTIEAIGTPATGGAVPIEIQNKLLFDAPKAIYATVDAFAVLTIGGQVYAWGSATNGGAIPPDIRSQLDTMKVQRIVASSTAFCAITEDGDLTAWGANGAIPSATLEKIYDDGGAQTVIANDGAFCVITLGRKKATTWGLATSGGTMSELTASLAAMGNIVLCTAAPFAMCFINEKGQSAAWGNAAYGGGTIPSRSNSDSNAEFALDAQALIEKSDAKMQIEKLFKSTKIVASKLEKRVSSRVKTADGGDVELIRNDGSFVLISKDPDGRTNNVISWGLATAGGDIPSAVKQTLYASNIRKVYSSNGAYAAIVDQGQVKGAVVTWGRASLDGGTIPPLLESALSSGVVEIYVIQSMPSPGGAVSSAFAARKENSNYVTWGAHVTNEEFTPDKELS